MAFAKTNVQTSSFGDLKVTYGDWTGTVGDAAGTIGVEGGRVYLAQFTVQDTDSPGEGGVPVSVSTSGSVTTITVYYPDTVTTGRFLIIHK